MVTKRFQGDISVGFGRTMHDPPNDFRPWLNDDNLTRVYELVVRSNGLVLWWCWW